MVKLNPKAKEILSLVGNFIFSFITAFIAVIAILFVIIKAMGWNLFSVDSGSMAPAYPVDSLVIVQDIEPEQIQVGDVITYVLNEDGVLVTHRVVQIDAANRKFITQGDANNTQDAPVLWDNVVGKVFLGIPGLGRPIRFLTDEDNRPIVIAVIASLFVASLVWDIVSQVKGRRGRHSDDPDGERRDSGVPSAEIKGSDSDKSEQTAGPVPDNAAPPSAGSLRRRCPEEPQSRRRRRGPR